MKPNKLTPGSNVMWESSRMMLPEHKQLLARHQKKLTERKKPVFDEQQMAVFSRLLLSALSQGEKVTVELFDPYCNRRVSGKIEKWNAVERKMKIMTLNGPVIVNLDEIVNVTAGDGDHVS